MKSYILPDEESATRVVVDMSRIINQQGHITVGQLHDLMGLSHTFADEKLIYTTSNHVLNPADNGHVSLEFPDPIDFRNEPEKSNGTIRLTMEFPASEEMEQKIATFLSVNTLRTAAKQWSVSKRNPPGPPRLHYTPRAIGGDDI